MVWNVHLLRYLWEVREELPGNRRQKKQILSRWSPPSGTLLLKIPMQTMLLLHNGSGRPSKLQRPILRK